MQKIAFAANMFSQSFTFIISLHMFSWEGVSKKKVDYNNSNNMENFNKHKQDEFQMLTGKYSPCKKDY